jgi:uncharacterized MnhB-related membrane protein
MAGLNNLPVEVILMILDYFEDISMLLSISLVSKRLCTIAQPRLFKAITLSTSFISLLLLLLRTVVGCPDLAAHVLSLEIGDAVDLDEESEPNILVKFTKVRNQYTVPLNFWGAEVAVIIKEVRNLNVLCRDSAPSILETTNTGILSILLISFTPNLCHLSVAVDHRHLSLLFNLAKRPGDSVSRPLSLGSLQSLHLECL